ncbi:desulfoferrodoxin family protein [Lachnobacterium bovis]|uniref:Desulfoferrodoxin n=1 Tax=Lachnobacterium bovis TaxID=140626 RepID=A0A1H9PD22_9FIRM|nr:desulfoferrodoxin family protein [Lachnobacterium bovis]SER46042.1 superoxide reductase [Lachnobacterium bovis]
MLFYKCDLCGNFITFLTDKTAATPVCCGEEMKEIVANTVDAAKEKHVPDVTVDGNKVVVKVGSVEHPMQDNHYIQFIIVETTNGYQKKDLKPGEKPEAEFVLAEGEKPVAVYEYCNLHGLWKTDI